MWAGDAWPAFLPQLASKVCFLAMFFTRVLFQHSIWGGLNVVYDVKANW